MLILYYDITMILTNTKFSTILILTYLLNLKNIYISTTKCKKKKYGFLFDKVVENINSVTYCHGV